ncbi:MAG TPA: DUF4124 domain-containing protein [Burkholderiales bacterium]|jgi:hypothetical protein|nr:DUF4124 domain-containing protein [Burkholderiales bacterium]
MRFILIGFLLALAAPALRADIYECVDSSGNKLFTNNKAQAKGCKLLSVSVPNTVPAPKAPAAKGGAAATPTPPAFPKVDTDTQRQRDTDRRRILEQELSSEERLLDQARKELASQDAVRLGSERNYQKVIERLEPYKKKVKLHEDNIASLRRELAAAK